MKRQLIVLISFSLLLGGCFKEEVKKEIPVSIQYWITQSWNLQENWSVVVNTWTIQETQTWIIFEDLNKTNTWIITDNKNINFDNKYIYIVDYIQSYKGFINEFKLWDNDIIRLSSINYNSSKDKALYVIWNRVDWEVFYNKDEFWEYTKTERQVNAIILYDKTLNSNKVIFIFRSYETRWFHRYWYPKFTYKDWLITDVNNVYINDISSYTWAILDKKSLKQFSFQDNLKTKWRFTYYILDNSNLSIEKQFWGWLFIKFPKIIWYSITNNIDKKNILFHYSYYKLSDDFNKLKLTKEFLENEKDIALWRIEWDKYNSIYVENIIKNRNFELSVLYENNLSSNNDLINESWHENIIKNKENKVILNIKDIDPKLVNFSFEKDTNIWNIDFNIFKITYKNKTIYFVYDLNNKKWSVINNKTGLSWFDKNWNIIFSDWVLNIWTLKFKEYIEINWL